MCFAKFLDIFSCYFWSPHSRIVNMDNFSVNQLKSFSYLCFPDFFEQLLSLFSAFYFPKWWPRDRHFIRKKSHTYHNIKQYQVFYFVESNFSSFIYVKQSKPSYHRGIRSYRQFMTSTYMNNSEHTLISWYWINWLLYVSAYVVRLTK